MTFEHHAFISYAHLDNEPLTPGDRGWVSQFHATLQTLLSQRLGEKVRIWRDEKLAGNDIFSDEIFEQFARTALLVSVLSPRYLKSEWCGRELTAFVGRAGDRGGLAVGNRSRFIKVVKTPLGESPPEALAAVLQQTLGFEFYREDMDPEEIDPAFGEEFRAEFLRRVSRLAVAMAESLREMARQDAQEKDAQEKDARPVAADGASAPAEAARAVFLAECGRDLRPLREELAADLRSHGFEVLPAQALPGTEDALRDELARLLPRCAWAVHLVGSSTGPVPDGPSGRSLVALQNEAAAELAVEGRLRRLIWIPDAARGERPEQQVFIEALLSSAALQAGADLLRGQAEALKVAMYQVFERAAAPVAAPSDRPTPRPDGKRLLHLLMTAADRSATLPLIRRLRARGFEVTLPLFTGESAATLRAVNGELAAAADVLMLFYGAGDEAWAYYQRNDLRKQAANSALAVPIWTALAVPATPDKELLRDLADAGTLDLLQGVDAVPDAALPEAAAIGEAERP
ncbi:MAG: TIR domain-containing protein [Rubrivivax sp.]|nr:MAG: TIR domain-containing protein [Rubrivivax sp.]